MPITAGSISVARRINTGDYSHKEAKVELHYVAEGDEDIYHLGALARNEALTQMAATLSTVVKLDETPELVIAGAPPENLKSAQVEQASKRHRRTKAEMGATDPIVTASTPPVATEAAPEADATSTVSTEPLTEISDKVLNNACNETMNRIKNKPAIQAIMQQYTHGTVATIPQESRTEFLNQLKAL